VSEAKRAPVYNAIQAILGEPLEVKTYGEEVPLLPMYEDEAPKQPQTRCALCWTMTSTLAAIPAIIGA